MCFLSLNTVLCRMPFSNIEGNCSHADSTYHYDTFIFSSGDADDTLAYTHIDSYYCGSGIADATDQHLNKEFFQSFYCLTYDSVNYSIDTSLRVRMIYFNRVNNLNNVFLIELDIPGYQNSAAFVYGSENSAGNPYGFPISYAYLISMDNSDAFASEYTAQELTETQIYNQNGTYLYEIKDSDRDNMLVGFNYYSPRTAKEYIKYILPNN